MSDSVRPHRRQPTRLPHPGDSLGKNTGVGCHFLLQCMKVKSQSEVAQLCPTLRDPMDCNAAYQAPLSMGFSRQEYWSEVPLRCQIFTTWGIGISLEKFLELHYQPCICLISGKRVTTLYFNKNLPYLLMFELFPTLRVHYK